INAGTGTIDVSTSTPGSYTVTYTTTGSCPNSSNVSVTINALDDASFSYSASSYCSADADPTPTITGLGGGSFSSTAGLSINAGTGAIDLSASTPGTYTVTYTTTGACPNSSNVSVTVTALDDASFSYSASAYCSNETDPTPTITGVAGGTFSSTAGLTLNTATGEIDLSTSTLGTYTVTYTTVGSCANSSVQNVTINAQPSAPTPVTPITVCPGDDVILSATGSGTGSIVFYDNTMTQLASVAMPPATATYNDGALANGTYTYSVAEDNGACESAPVAISVLVGDATNPIAVCQDINLYLDGAGTASIVAADIDGGSSDNCGTVTLAASQSSFDCTDIGGSAAGILIITGAYDGPLTGGTPKGVELYVANDIADLSQYGLGSANNGGGTDGEEFTFPAVSATAGTYIYVSSEATQFTNFFGFAPDYTTSSMGINGDDAVELFHMGSVIDVFGDINLDGSGQPWDYLDGWASRNNGTGPDGTTFTLGNWSFSGINVYDGQTTNATSPTPMPIGTFTPASSGSTAVTLTVTDGSGNMATCTANVTVLDTVSPTISCPIDQTVSLDASCQFTLIDYTSLATASDNCGMSSLTQSPAAGTVITADQVVTLTATDVNGNTSTCTFNVIVSDVTPPTAVCQNINVFLDGAGNATIVAADVDGGSSDNCGAVTFSATPTAFTCANVGANTVTLTVTDGNFNTATCTATVTVVDTISPVLTCPGDQTETASPICDLILPDYTALGSATDNCAGSSNITQSPAAGTLITGNTTITLTADDGNGNTTTCTFQVILDVSGCAGTECSNAIVVGPHDPCGETSVLSGSTVGGTPSTESFCGTSLGSGGANWYTFTGDGANWTASTVSGGTNYDTKIWVYEGTCGSLLCVTGNDDFSGVQSQVSFLTTLGTTYYVVVGGFSANEGNYDLTLTNVEVIPPTLSCPGDQTESVSPTCDFTLPDYTGLATATDNCDPNPVVTQSPAAGTVITADQLITITAQDADGNTSTCTFNVILTGAVPPVAVCQDVTLFLDASGNASIVAADIDGGSSSTCGTPTLSASTTSFTCADIGTNTVTLTVTDALGNTDDCIATVTVSDSTSPTPDAASLADIIEGCAVTVLVDPSGSDNCGTVTVTNDATLPISTQGITLVTWTYDDGNGNTTTQTQNVVINDVSSPLPTAAPLPDVTGECSVDVMPTAPTAVDACAGTITGVETSGTTFPVTAQGTTILVWEFDDGNGNIATQTQNIVVNDVTGPAPDSPTLADLTGDCSIDAPTAPTATDNCTGTITGTTTTTFPITAIGTTTIVWEFADGNGNVTTQTQDAINSGIDASAALEADGVTITANTAGATYAWVNCDFNTTISGETGQSFTPSANGNYAVIVTVGACSDTSACENITSVGIDALAIDQLSVYPNPSESGFFTVSYDGNIEAIEVVDMLGREIVLPTDLTTGLVDGSELAYGRYMVRVTTENSVLTTEIVIAR
ncbi:MAG: HYR domain-containing protein, partial [Crocinitomicaceae bacterium]|nr:HYR domain-containing protein [Crocinitomicaceae bacterium]